MRVRFWLGMLVLLTLTLGCTREKRSVVLVTVAGLRADAIDAARAPRLAALKSEGAFAANVVAPAPDTVPSVAGIMTGREPGDAGVPFGDLARVAKDATTLAEALKAKGYETRAYVGQGELAAATGLARGFDSFSTPSSQVTTAAAADELTRTRAWRGGAFRAADVLQQFVTYFRARPNTNPVFAWVHLGDLAEGLDPADPKGSYARLLGEVDDVVGGLRDALDSYGFSGRTTLIVASTNGLALGDGGEIRSGLTLTPSVVEVPVFVAGEGADDARLPASLRGLHGLVLAAAGAGKAEDPPAESIARLPARLYGWPEARRRPGAAEPGVDALVLDTMAKAHAAVMSGRMGDAVALLEEACRRAPDGLAPRLALADALQAIAASAGGGVGAGGAPNAQLAAEARRRLEPVLAEIKVLAVASNPTRLDAARALAAAGDNAAAIGLVQAVVSAEAGSTGTKAVPTAGERLAAVEILSSAGATDAATEQLATLVEAEPEAPELQEWLGDLLLGAGNAYRARVAYEKAAAVPRGRTANLLAKLGDALAQLGEKDAALKQLAAALEIDPSYRYPHARAAQIFLEKGEKGAAADALVKSIGSTGNAVQDAINQARILEKHGLLDQAGGVLTEARQQNPGNPLVEVAVARLLAAAGQPDKARVQLKAVTDVKPDVAQAWVELARIEAGAKNEAAAIAALDRAEPVGGPGITATVRQEPAFRAFGPESALARRAAAFSGKAAPKTQDGVREALREVQP